MKKWIVCLMAVTMLSSCSYFEHKELKSPCVGIEKSPCGPKRNVNDNWLG